MLSYKAVREGLSKEVNMREETWRKEGSDSKISEGACEPEGTGVAKALREGVAGVLSEMTVAEQGQWWRPWIRRTWKSFWEYWLLLWKRRGGTGMGRVLSRAPTCRILFNRLTVASCAEQSVRMKVEKILKRLFQQPRGEMMVAGKV